MAGDEIHIHTHSGHNQRLSFVWLSICAEVSCVILSYLQSIRGRVLLLLLIIGNDDTPTRYQHLPNNKELKKGDTALLKHYTQKSGENTCLKLCVLLRTQNAEDRSGMVNNIGRKFCVIPSSAFTHNTTNLLLSTCFSYPPNLCS